VTGIKLSLQVLADQSWRDRLDPRVYALARRITGGEPTVDRKVQAIARYARSETAGIELMPFDPAEGPAWGAGADADDLALAVASLCLAAGIRVRIVGARFGASWTCWVDYWKDGGDTDRNDGGEWVRVGAADEPGRQPDETIDVECID